MDAHDVADYLKRHPEFFAEHTELLHQIDIPSPHGDKAVSLTERQMGVLRERIRQLEAKLAELISFGEENDAISSKVHRLGVALLGAGDLPGVMRALYAHLGGDFAVPHVAVRLWGIGGAGNQDGAEHAAVDDAVKALAGGLRHPYCGAAGGQDAVAWLGEAASHVRSVAQMPLRESDEAACFGLLVLGSEEAQRFYPEMGTLYLRRIGDMAAAALLRVAG